MFSFSRPVWILFAGTLINRFGSFVTIFLILYLTRNGYSIAQAGLAVAVYGAGGMVASIVGGHLADSLGRRAAIAASMFSAAITIVALERADTLPLIIALTGLVGFTAELYRPASSALLIDLTKDSDRVTAFAGYRLAINLGTSIGPAVGGLLAERSFSLLFYADAITCAAFGVIALVALPEGVRPSRDQEAEPALRVILADRAFLRFLLASTAAAFVYAQSYSTFPLQVTASGFSTAVYGALLGLNGLVVLILELPIATVTRRLPRRPVIALGMALIGAGFGLTGIADTVPLLVVAVVVWTLGEIVSAPVAGAYVADLAPEALRGRYQGAWTLTFGIGFVIGPTLGTRVFSWNPGGLWAACAVLGLIAAAVVMSNPPSRWRRGVAGSR